MPVNMDKLISLDRAKEIKTAENGMVATVEASSTASKAYAVGSYFYYTGKLYKTTAPIASGGTITPGTNCTLAKLGDDVGDLKSAITPLYSTLMEQGYWKTVDTSHPLTPVDLNYVIRTKDYTPWTPGMRVVCNSGYQAQLALVASNYNYILVNGWSDSVTSDNTTAAYCMVSIKTTNSSALTPDMIANAISYSDVPLFAIKPMASEEDFEALSGEVTALEGNVSGINSSLSTLYVYDSVPVELETGLYDKYGNTTNTFKHASLSVEPGEKYIVVAGSFSSNDYPLCLFRNDGEIVGFEKIASAQMVQAEVTIPDSADEMIVNTSNSYVDVQKGTPVSAKPYSKWYGKKIAWFGTSIPETSTYNAVLGYPEYVGKLIGATVYNEAIGSSCARRGFKSEESADDPYGWTNMGAPALWNMGSTVEEKNELITNWESKWRALTGYDETLSEATQAKAIACSYENKLVQKYITANPVDLYVFDHGYNDWKVGDLDANPEDPYDRSTFQGAMNTFIKAILEANPRARIVVISHYEDQERAGLIEMQEAEAEYWNLPFCELYKKLGWAKDRTVTTTGYWSNGTGNGIWIESGGASQTINLKQYHMPDGRHPNIDISGKACMDIAYVIADFINSITPAG